MSPDPDRPPPGRWRRVVLKLSGEALRGESSYGIDTAVLNAIARQLRTVAVDLGVQIGIVVGGGNIWRGEAAARRGMDRVQADYAGMLATIINGLGPQDAPEQGGAASPRTSAH